MRTNRQWMAGLASIACYVMAAAADSQESSMVFREDFARGLDNWVWEGAGTVHVVDGRAVMEPAWKDEEGHNLFGALNMWCRRRLPADFRIELDCHPIREDSNLVFMVCAELLTGQDLIETSAERNGMYLWITNKESTITYKPEFLRGKTIPPMQSYTFSYWFPGGRRMPARKNPGHHLTADCERDGQTVEAKSGKPFHVVIEKAGPRLRFLVDGETIHDFTDPADQQSTPFTLLPDGTVEHMAERRLPVYGEGYFGLRTLGATVAFDTIVVTSN